MTQKAEKRPQKGDYAVYFEKYIALVPSGDFLEILREQHENLIRRLAPLSEEQANFRYAEDKWSIKETIGHICDTERIFAYRLLRIARGDQTPLASFEQDDYVQNANFAARKMADILHEFSAVREATVALMRSLDDAAWQRRGIAGQKEITAQALAFIIAGHERHHSVILGERYLPALAAHA
jgi:uncharacterized damage-inducible protein DinB